MVFFTYFALLHAKIMPTVKLAYSYFCVTMGLFILSTSNSMYFIK